jgi:hypothetical protein
MANDTSKNFSTIVLKKFLPAFESDLVLAKSVDSQLLKGEINPNTGDSIQFKRPHQYVAERTSDGDVTGSTKNALTSATATGSIGEYITVRVEYSQLEQAVELNQLEEILAPIAEEMVTTLETEMSTRMNEAAALISGLPDTAIDQWSDVASGSSFLKDLGVKGMNFAALDPWSVQDLADAQGGLSSGSDSLVDRAWKDAQISQNFGGLKGLMTNGLSDYTSGTQAGVAGVTVSANPTVTYTSPMKDTYNLTVVLKGLGATNTLKKGDVVQFDETYWLNQQTKSVLRNKGAAIPFTGTVTADATAVAGVVTVVLSGAAFFDAANEQYNSVSRAIITDDAVTILGTASTVYKPSLFYNKMGFGIGSVELPKLHSIDSSVVNHKGFSLRVHKYSDGDANKQMVRFDLLPSFCVFNPLMIGKLYGRV